MQDKTLVGWDASPAAEAALRWAVERERRRDGAIAIVFVVADDGHRALDDSQQRVDEAAAALRDAATRVRERAPGCLVTTTTVRGPLVDGLLQFANPEWILVVGADRRGPARPRSGMSLGARLAAAAHGPVAVVPGGSDPTARGVVVGFDGSAEAYAALDVATAEAHRSGDHLIVVHSWMEPVVMEGQPMLDPQFVAALEGESQQLLDAAHDRVARLRPETGVVTHSVHAPAAPALVRASEHARLTVVGTRGLRGIRRILLGSVSRELVSAATGPVLVVGGLTGARTR